MVLQIIIIVLIIGIGVLLIKLLGSKKESSQQHTEHEKMLEERMAAHLDRMRAEMKASNDTMTAEMRNQHAKEMEQLRHSYEQQLATLQQRLETRDAEVQKSAANEFRALSQEILQQNSRALTENNSQQIGAVLAPLRERIEQFSKSFNQAYVDENATRKSLTDQIDRLMELNRTIGDEAKALTAALKGDSKVQGDWGEAVLERLLEKAGLKRDVNFFVQVTSDTSGQTIRNEEGRVLRPDVVILMPQKKYVVVDSKVSLTAYADYMAESDPKTRTALGKKHIESVKKHIKELETKNYQSLVPGSAEQVLMFMPIEGAYYTAMQLEPSLWDYAYERNIVIVSPIHIFSVVQIISQIWRQEKQSVNALEIAKTAGLLYDSFVKFTDDFRKISLDLAKVQKSYDTAYSTLTSDRVGMIRRAQKLKEMGAKAQKSLSDELLLQADITTTNTDTDTTKN